MPPGLGLEFPRRDDTDWSIALNASLDIFRGGAKIAERRQALEELLRLQTERAALVNLIEQGVRANFHLAGASFAAIQQSRLAAEASGKNVRVVSMPCVELFEAQDAAYKESVLPKAVTARVAVEAAIMDGWWKYVGMNGAVVGMTTFGESAPAPVLFEHFGFTVDNVVKTIDSVA